MQEHFVLMTSLSPPQDHGGLCLVKQVPEASTTGQLGPGWEVALSIQVAQICIGCLCDPFPLEQEVKIQDGVQDNSPLRL